MSADDELLCSQMKQFVDYCRSSEGWEEDKVFAVLLENGGNITKELFHNILSVSLVNEIPEYTKLWLRTAIAKITKDSSLILLSPIRPMKKKAPSHLPSMSAHVGEPESGPANVATTPKVPVKRCRSLSSTSPSKVSKKCRVDNNTRSTILLPPGSERLTTVFTTKSGRSASRLLVGGASSAM